MTYEEARKRFSLRPHDKVNIESAKRYLEHDMRLLNGYLESSLRKDIELDIEALKILLKQEKKGEE